MKIFEKLKSHFQDFLQAKTPYNCKDGYVVIDNEKLPYQLLIEKIKNDRTSRGFDLTVMVKSTYEFLDKEDKIQFSYALLDRLFFLETQEDTFHERYLYPSAVAQVFQYLDSTDMDVFLEILRKCNDAHYESTLPFEEEFLERLLIIARTSGLSPKLKTEMERRFKYYLKLKKEAEEGGHFYYQRLYVLYGKILGKHDSTLIFQEGLDESFTRNGIEHYFKDGFPLGENDAYYQEQIDLDRFLNVELSSDKYSNLKDCPTLKEKLGRDKITQKNFLMALMYRIVWLKFDAKYDYQHYDAATIFARRKLPYTEKELIFILRAYLHPNSNRLAYFSIISFFKNVESHVKTNGISDALKELFKEFLATEDRPNYSDKDFKKLKIRIDEMRRFHFAEEGETTVVPFLMEDIQFGKQVNQDIEAIDLKNKDKWYKLLRHASTANGGKPSKKMVEKAKLLVDDIGEKVFLEKMQTWLVFLSNMEIFQQSEWYGYYISSVNVPTVKGLIWSLSTIENSELDSAIEKLIVRCFKKIPGVGPASGALGNACIYTIGKRNSLTGVALLNRVRSKIAQRNTKSLIGKYIAATAEELKISISDLEDFAIQDFGLNEGVKEFLFNDYKARLSLISFGKTKLEWIKPDGKIQKSIPAFVRKDFASELKAIRSDAKLIPKTLTIQRDRLDRSYIQKRILTYSHFEKYYFQHGLMSYLSTKLIWTFSNEEQKVHAIWHNGQWQDVNGAKITWIDEDTKVQLWHPLHSETEEILKWRDFLQEHEIKQPLKQAYREVYILTDAEVNTQVYSNRMAAHILKQHQFNALAGIRGWKYQLMGAYDDGVDAQTCSLQIPDYNLSAEFWINELNAEDAFNDTGIWLYVATDQVRFTNGNTTIDLINVPKIVFSETMRDVDLFVGVGSVGNDPAWQDNGGLQQFHDYWESYSFGDLTELAKTRKTILEKLLPRLNIAEVASIQGKFLVVEGKKRTYKIHIGSTNILMEPNDQYLCIVPARSSKPKQNNLFIPFEGDRGFSILLSKAFMLAEDDKIEDATILSQINR